MSSGTCRSSCITTSCSEYTGEEEGDVLFRTEEELRGDLQWLYDNNFYVVTMQEYIENRMTAPAGKHPVVLTFDDSRPNQFYYDIADDGSVTIDPHSVMAILEDFFATHPDFGHTALFAILPISLLRLRRAEQTPIASKSCNGWSPMDTRSPITPGTTRTE